MGGLELVNGKQDRYEKNAENYFLHLDTQIAAWFEIKASSNLRIFVIFIAGWPIRISKGVLRTFGKTPYHSGLHSIPHLERRGYSNLPFNISLNLLSGEGDLTLSEMLRFNVNHSPYRKGLAYEFFTLCSADQYHR